MNWGQIKQAVRDYLENNETTFTGHFADFARLAEEDIYRKLQLQYTKQTADTTMIADDPFLSVPSDALSVYSLASIDPTTGEYNFLLPKDQAYLREAYPDPAETGSPRFYAYRNDQLFLIAPTPNVNYQMEIHYYLKPQSISINDEDTNDNWLSRNGENALIFGIIMHGYIYEKGDQDVVGLYKSQFETAINDLKLITEGRQRKDVYRQPDQRIPV